jgi:hypothetical protein
MDKNEGALFFRMHQVRQQRGIITGVDIDKRETLVRIHDADPVYGHPAVKKLL